MFKKYKFIFALFTFLMIGSSQYIHGQTLTFTLSSDTGVPNDTVIIPIAVDSFMMMSGYQGTLRWDSAVLDFVDLNSPTTGISNIFGSPGQGLIPLDAATFTWVDFSGLGKTLPDSSIVMEIRFVIKSTAPFGITPVMMDSSVTLLGFSTGASFLTPIVSQGSVTVIDTLAPSAICQNRNLYLDSLGQGILSPDDIDGGSTVSSGPAQLWVSKDSFDCSDLGGNHVNLYIMDNNGSTDSCMAVVTVIDTIAPEVVCQNLSITLDSTGKAEINVSMIDAGSSDACGIQNITLSQDTFGIADIGEQEITLTAIDSSGNVSSCIATVTVENTTSIKDSFLPASLLSLKSYPNPVDNFVSLEWNSPWYGSVSIVILNQLGQNVHQEIRSKNTMIMQTNLEVQDLPKGIYLIQVSQNSYIRYTRILKK